MSSIPSSAMPHAKVHDDEDEHHAPQHDKAQAHHAAEEPEKAATQDGSTVSNAIDQVKQAADEVETKAVDTTGTVTREAVKLADKTKSTAEANPKTSFAVGAVVAVGIAALAALPFILSKSDAKKPKPKKKPKPHKAG